MDFQRTISTQKSCRIYTKRLTRFTPHDMSSQQMISLVTGDIKSDDAYTLISSRSSVTQHVCLKVWISQCRIEWKWIRRMKNCFCHDVENIPPSTRDYVPSVWDRSGMKKSSIELFFRSGLPLKTKKKENGSNELSYGSVIIFSYRWLQLVLFSSCP